MVPLLLFAALPSGRAVEVSFTRAIAPVLVEQCLECHREGKAKGSYRLDTWRELQKAGDSEAPPVVPGAAERSELWRLIATHEEEDRMPKKADPLPSAQVTLIRDWIAAGALFDGGEEAWDRSLAELVPEEKALPAPERYPHPLPVVALAPQPGSDLLAVGGYREVTLWKVENGALAARWGGLPERVLALEWVPTSAGGSALLVAGGVPGRSGGLWWIDPEAREPRVLPLLRTNDCLMALAVSRDGRQAVVAGADNTVRCLELPSGRVRWSLEAHADWVLGLAMSPDGTKVATASRDRSARLIDLARGEIDATFTAHGAPVTCVRFDADGKTVFTGDAGGEIRRWNLEGEAAKDSTLRAGRSEVTALALAGDQWLATLAEGQLVPLDLPTRQAQEPLVRSGDRLESLRVVPTDSGGAWVFAGGHDGRVHRLTLPLRKSQDAAESKVKTAPTGPVPALQFIASPGWSPP